MRPRLFAVAMAAGLVLAGCQQRAPDAPMLGERTREPSLVKLAPPPPAPNLGGYVGVPADDYLVTDQYERYVSFQTPDGLTCRIEATAGCDGPVHGTPAPANEVALGGFAHTSKPQFAGPAGGPAKALPVGHKIVFGDFQCAAASGAITMCTRGSPPAGWFVLSPTVSGIGPRNPGLPARFPDPHDFVIDENNYGFGPSPMSMFPYFTVASGLTCKIGIFSGGEVGCDGPLPGAPDGENEIYVDFSGRQVGMRRTDSPRFKTPGVPGTIRQLPAQHRIDYTYERDCTCLASSDGGVGCIADIQDQPRGFVVSSHAAWTFGG
jgi:hypothetical protein